MQNKSTREASEQERISALFWALGVVWPMSRFTLLGIFTSTLVRGLVPAGFAIAIRGLINATSTSLNQPSDGFTPALIWLVFAFAVTLTEALVSLLQQFFSDRLRGDLTLEINNRILHHAAHLDLPYFENTANREIIEHIQRSPGTKVYQLIQEAQKALLAGFQVLSLVSILIWLEPLILVAIVFLALPFLLFQWRLARRRFTEEQQRTTKRRWTRWYLLRLTSPETIGEIRLLGIGGLLANRCTTAMQGFRQQDRRLQFRQLLGSGLFALLITVTLYLLFTRVAQQVLDGQLTVGDLAIFAGAVVRLRGALDSGIRAIAIAYERSLLTIVLRNFLKTHPVVKDEGIANVIPETGSVDVSGLCFRYPGNSNLVLRNLSFNVASGETVAIVGENGSGKSTLAKLLVRLYDPDQGQILLDGHPIADYPLKNLHHSVSLLGQSYGRYEATVAENIAYGDWERLRGDRDEIEKLAELTGVSHLADKLPQGLDTSLGREFSNQDLSGGQWQRLAIARALARPAKLLILDEPTSNVDAHAEHDLFTALAAAIRGCTTIIISHRFSTLRMADRILVMHKGEIVEQGTHEALLAANGRYTKLYELHERYRIRV